MATKKNNNKYTVVLDFTNAYANEEKYLNTPWEGWDSIPVAPKTTLWQKLKNWFTRK